MFWTQNLKHFFLNYTYHIGQTSTAKAKFTASYNIKFQKIILSVSKDVIVCLNILEQYIDIDGKLDKSV